MLEENKRKCKENCKKLQNLLMMRLKKKKRKISLRKRIMLRSNKKIERDFRNK